MIARRRLGYRDHNRPQHVIRSKTSTQADPYRGDRMSGTWPRGRQPSAGSNEPLQEPLDAGGVHLAPGGVAPALRDRAAPGLSRVPWQLAEHPWYEIMARSFSLSAA